MSRHYAVIGSGVAGLLAAHVLAKNATVTMYEADSRPGGHAHTHQVRLADGTEVAVDSGFIVHNARTYPTLLRLFAELNVPTQPTVMSMSIATGDGSWQYAGGQGMTGILGHPRTVARPQFLRMLLEIKRFHRRARTLLSTPDDLSEITFGDWLAAGHFGDTFVRMFARPLVAAVWSCDDADALGYPARSLLSFLEHHGMLSVGGSPTWATVSGGSRVYVDRVLQGLHEVRLSTPVTGLEQRDQGVLVHDRGGQQHYDGVVVATHPHQALAMLAQPTAEQREVLGALTYSVNPAVLHTDTRVLPGSPRVRAAWNYRLGEPGQSGVLVSYDLTRLMRLPSPGGQRILVTLNGADQIDPERVLARVTYEHPLYTADAVRAQRRLPGIGTDRLAFAGAYHGSGFHEDGALSGLRAAERLGGHW